MRRRCRRSPRSSWRWKLERLTDDVRAELRRFGPQAGMAELVERWPAAVGEQIAQFAWPARIARDGTVHVNTADSVWAFELSQRAAEIGGRLGGAVLRFAPGPLPDPPLDAAPAPVSPTAEEAHLAAALAAPVGDEMLRESVQKALAFALARARADAAL